MTDRRQVPLPVDDNYFDYARIAFLVDRVTYRGRYLILVARS